MTAAEERLSLLETVRLHVRNLSNLAAEIPGVGADLKQLLTDEVHLGATEMRESAAQAGIAVGIVVAGAALAAFGLFFACLTLMFLLATAMNIWLAALMTTLVLFGLAYLALRVGSSRLKRVHPIPHRFVEGVREDVAWLRSLPNSTED